MACACRPLEISFHTKKALVRAVLAQPKASIVSVSREYGARNVSASTIRRALHAQGLAGRVKRRKPLITKRHVTLRKAWEASMAQLTSENLAKIIFSDEFKFNLFGSDGKEYCWRRPGEEFSARNLKPTVKHGGGSLMVWGCITSKGPGRLYRIPGIMDSALYTTIIEESHLPTLADYGMTVDTTVFQQDNDPKHTSRHTRASFENKGIHVLPWAPMSPDMNIIEHVWDHIDRQIRKRPQRPTNLNQLWEALSDEWKNMDMDFIDLFYASLPDRISALSKPKEATLGTNIIQY